MSKLSIKAPAKLNLHLQVLDKRTDGYHNISSYFTLIDFFDELEFSLKENEIILNESETY